MKRILGLLLALYVPAASAVFKCTDDKGETLFGDTPPAACSSHAPIYEIGPGGRVLQKIEPVLTPEQLKEREAEQARAKKAAAAAAEQKRRDMALLNSYSSAQEFDVARDRNIEPVAGRIHNAEERLKELDAREEELNKRLADMKEAAEKSKRGADDWEPPAWLTANLERVQKERANITTGIARYKKEVEELRAKYDNDKKRWIMLKQTQGTLDGAAADPAKPPAKDSKGY